MIVAPILVMTAGSFILFKGDMMTRWQKPVIGTSVAGLLILLLVQLVPYGRTHSNPPVTGSPRWDSPATERLVRLACYDCHSNETKWPWYASIAPVSWRVQKHVEEGRSKLNFSKFDQPQEEAHEAAETVQKGEMPPWDYALMHPEIRLSATEKQALIRGLQATFGGTDSREGEHEKENDDSLTRLWK